MTKIFINTSLLAIANGQKMPTSTLHKLVESVNGKFVLCGWCDCVEVDDFFC